MIGKLFTGKKVKHRGTHFTMESARLWTMPATPPPIYVATSGPIMAYRTGKFTDGLITVGAADEKLKMLVERYETGARDAGKDPATMPKILQVKVSYAPTVEEATEAAVRDWPNGGMAFPKGDIREPEDFEAMAKLVRPENYKNRVLIAIRPGRARGLPAALHRPRLRRDLRPQRRPRPGAVYHVLWGEGDTEVALAGVEGVPASPQGVPVGLSLASGGVAFGSGGRVAALRGEEREKRLYLLDSDSRLTDLPTHRLTDCYTPSRIAFGVEVRSASYADQVPTGGIARERARDVA